MICKNISLHWEDRILLIVNQTCPKSPLSKKVNSAGHNCLYKMLAFDDQSSLTGMDITRLKIGI